MNNRIAQPLFLVPHAGRSARSMSRELRRWLPRKTRTVASPWAQWARAHAERYAGLLQRRSPLGLVLLKRRGLTRILRERWMMKSERLLPSINLSVNAILRASGQTVFRQVNAPADRNAQALQPPALVDRRTMDAQAAMSRNPTRESNATAKFVRRDAIASPSSLERIFRRSRSTDARTQMAGTLGHPLEVQQTVAQLVQRSQRIESRPGEPAITTARSFDSTLPVARKEASHSAPTPDHGVEAFDSDTQAALRTTDSGPDSSVWPDLARARESINIEQITDQVIRRLDQKVVAARERIGRTF